MQALSGQPFLRKIFHAQIGISGSFSRKEIQKTFPSASAWYRDAQGFEYLAAVLYRTNITGQSYFINFLSE
ncbi:MAG: hypothetical protein R2764_15180 [Bacteroidales bacterium]